MTTPFTTFDAKLENGVLTIDMESMDIDYDIKKHTVLEHVECILPSVRDEDAEWLRRIKIDADSLQYHVAFHIYGLDGWVPSDCDSVYETFHFVGHCRADDKFYAVSTHRLDNFVEVTAEGELRELLKAVSVAPLKGFLQIPLHDELNGGSYMFFPSLDTESELLEVDGLYENGYCDEKGIYTYSALNIVHRGDKLSAICLDGEKTLIVENHKGEVPTSFVFNGIQSIYK